MVDLDFQVHKYKLPEGLDDLMGDITREVLRAQPENICGFIAQYLGALMNAREALIIAGDVCEHSCTYTNALDLESQVMDGTAKENNENAKLDVLREINYNSEKHYADNNTIDEYKPSCSQDTKTMYNGPRIRKWRGLSSRSVFSLAGSYMNLPKSRPYSVHDSDTTEDSKLFTRNVNETIDSDWRLENIKITEADEDSVDLDNFLFSIN